VSIAVPAAPFNGYSEITGYEYSEDNFSFYTVSSFPVVFTGLTNGTSKTVWIRARNAYGAGPAGSAASTPRTTPGAPGVSSTPANGSISVSYSAPASDGGESIDSYEYSLNGSSGWTVPSSNPFTLSGANGTAITVYMRANNDAGSSSSASTSSTPRTTPGAPSVTSTPTNGSVSIGFGAPASDGGNAISSYQYSTDNSSWVGTPSNPFSINGANGTAITIYVRAVNAAGGGTSSSATSTPRTTPGAPTNVTSTPGNGSVSIAFGAPSSNGGNAVSAYQYSTDNSTFVATPSNPFTINGANGTAITIYVRAVNAAGAGTSASATSTPRQPPSAPTSFAGNNATFAQIGLSWGAPSSDGGNAVTSYVLRNGSTILQNSIATSYTHTGLLPYEDYSYTVTAVNAGGEGTQASLTIKTLGGIAKVWNGTSWITTLPKVWNGTSWVDAQARMWNGTEWKHGI
jgi:titin